MKKILLLACVLMAKHAFCQDLTLSQLLFFHKKTFSQVELELTSQGWSYHSQVHYKNMDGVVWDHYNKYNVQMLVGFVTMKTNPLPKAVSSDSTWILYRSMSRAYYENFLKDLDDLNFVKGRTSMIEDGVRKIYNHKYLNYYVVIDEVKNTSGNTAYRFEIFSFDGYMTWFLNYIMR